MRKSKILLTIILSALAAHQAAAGGWTSYLGSGPSAKKARAEQAAAIQKASVEGQIQVFDSLIEAGGNQIMNLDNQKPLTLENLRKLVPKIQYVPQEFLFATDANGQQQALDCRGSLDAQWLMAKDSPSGKPLVALMHTNDTDLAAGDWMLLTHETISSLGVVDDEYQVTSPLFALHSISAQTKTSMSRLMADPNYAEIAKTLKNVRLRERAPRYELDANDVCFKWKGGRGILVNPEMSGGTTGIGGGGDASALLFKVSLLTDAQAGWKKFHQEGQGEKEKQAFMRILSSLGVEPLPNNEGDNLEHYSSIIPIQMEFKKSKRTGAFSVYFLVDDLESGGHWQMARAMIYQHVAKYMVPAKTKALRDRHAVYGGEIAYHRKATKELNFDDSGPYFLKK